MVFLILCDMLHWGKSLLLPLPLTRESFVDFVPKWDNLEMFFFERRFFFFFGSHYPFILVREAPTRW